LSSAAGSSRSITGLTFWMAARAAASIFMNCNLSCNASAFDVVWVMSDVSIGVWDAQPINRPRRAR
jgi:hypothetical protein